MSRFGLWAAAVLPSITLVTSAQGSDDCAARYKNYLEKFTPDVQRKMSGEQLAALNRRAQRIYDACETGHLADPKALFDRLELFRQREELAKFLCCIASGRDATAVTEHGPGADLG
jgi:hypothetical protein